MLPLLGLLAGGLLVEVRAGTTDRVDPAEHTQALQVVLQALAQRGTAACVNQRAGEVVAGLDSPSCDGQSPNLVLNVGLFGGISQVRWLLTRQTPAGREVGQLQLDLKKGASPEASVALALERLLPKAPPSGPAVLPPPPAPPPPAPPPETPAWVPVVGAGAAVAAVAGGIFLGSALVAKGNVGEPAQDPMELEELESRRVTHGTIGGLLMAAAIGAAVALVTSTP